MFRIFFNFYPTCVTFIPFFIGIISLFFISSFKISNSRFYESHMHDAVLEKIICICTYVYHEITS